MTKAIITQSGLAAIPLAEYQRIYVVDTGRLYLDIPETKGSTKLVRMLIADKTNIRIGQVTTGDSASADITQDESGCYILNLVLPAGAAADPNYLDISELTDGYLSVPGVPLPVAVTTNSGSIYPIEKYSLSQVSGGYQIDPAPYLAYDNSATFEGTWRVWRAGGVEGPAGTIEIGTVTTGVPGSLATVENVGTPSNAVLNISIPQGMRGESGEQAANYVQVSALTDGMLRVDSTTMPVIVETDKGSIYPVEKGSIQLTAGYYVIDPAPYLAYDNVSSFTGPWKIWRAGGRVQLPESMILTSQVIAYAGPEVPEGFLPCNGSAISRVTYANLFGIIGTLYGAGDGSTTFNLPDLRGRSLQGVGTDVVGTVKSAGLPDINGTLRFGAQTEYYIPIDSASGAFSATGTAAEDVRLASTSTKPFADDERALVGFAASHSNPIYGGSTTVQPPAVIVNYCIKY